MTKITQVEVRDVKRIEYLKVEPKTSLTIIGGDNAEGKTSFLDAVACCLGGKKLCPTKPIRKGQTTAEISIKLDGEEKMLLPPCTVTRRFSLKGDRLQTELEIVSDDNYTAPMPQGICDQLVSMVAFDPLAFSRMKPMEQADLLQGLVGLDFTEIDLERQKEYDARRDVNRDLKKLEGALEQTPRYADAPDEDVSTQDLLESLQKLRKINLANQEARSRLKEINNEVTRRLEDVAKAAEAVKSWDERLSQAKQLLGKAEQEAKSARQREDEHSLVVASLHDENVEEVELQIRDAGATNQKVAANKRRKAMSEEVVALKARSMEHTDAIEQLDEKKALLNAQAKWPIDGLGFGPDGVTYQDLPFDQSSSAEQLKISVAIGFALNPALPLLLIRDGSLLDDQSVAEVAIMAAEKGGQVFMERVGEGSECHVVLRDGRSIEDSDEKISN